MEIITSKTALIHMNTGKIGCHGKCCQGSVEFVIFFTFKQISSATLIH